MRYIRTNEEIWDTNEIKVKEKNSRDLWEGYFIKDNCIYAKSRYWIIDEKYGVEYRRLAKIIKQGNTIEELCDAFIYIDVNKDNLLYEKDAYGIGNSLEELKPFTKEGDVIYGAIWTPSGLSYVAKFNRKKGELELL